MQMERNRRLPLTGDDGTDLEAAILLIMLLVACFPLPIAPIGCVWGCREIGGLRSVAPGIVTGELLLRPRVVEVLVTGVDARGLDFWVAKLPSTLPPLEFLAGTLTPRIKGFMK